MVIMKMLVDEVKSHIETIVLGVKEEERQYILDWMTTTLDQETQDQLRKPILGRRTGRLAQSTRWIPEFIEGESGLKEIRLGLFSSVPYARIQNVGGVVSARSGSYLTVPLPAALTPVGVLRKRAREWKDSFFIRSRLQNLLLVQSRGKQIVPLFVLKKSVTLKPTRWATRAVEEALKKL